MLMDGGSTINIFDYDTFCRMHLLESTIEATQCTFNGIVLGRKAYPIGKITTTGFALQRHPPDGRKEAQRLQL
jgi:hypothetical protein